MMWTLTSFGSISLGRKKNLLPRFTAVRVTVWKSSTRWAWSQCRATDITVASGHWIYARALTGSECTSPGFSCHGRGQCRCLMMWTLTSFGTILSVERKTCYCGLLRCADVWKSSRLEIKTGIMIFYDG